jgi:TIR domain
MRRHNVWLDKWELSVGDSLIDKIQDALTESSAILIILSRNSVTSNWCRKELNAGLIRELEEKKSILIPCVIDDCELPLFLRKNYTLIL